MFKIHKLNNININKINNHINEYIEEINIFVRQMATRNMEKYLSSFINKEIQIKITMNTTSQ